MEIKSKFHWKIIIIMIFTISLGLTLLVFIWTTTFHDNKPIPNGVYVLPCALGTFGIMFLLFTIIYFKRFIITTDGFTVKYIFHKRQLVYKNKDLIGYSEYSNGSGSGRYESFHLKMADGRIFMMVDYEYSNFNKITAILAAKTKQAEISRYHNVKLAGILFGISVLFVSLTTFLIIYIDSN